MRRVLGFALLVILAGCIGVNGNRSHAPAEPEPPDAAWSDGNGINATRLAQQHFATLREAGSFTHNQTDKITVEGDVRPDGYYPPSFTHEQVNLDAGRYRGTFVTVGERQSTTFISPAVKASRHKSCTSTACEYHYEYEQRPEGDTRSERISRYRTASVVNSLTDQLERWNFTYNGTTQQNGTTLYRYTATQTLSHPIPVTDEPPQGSATLLVTDRGVIRQLKIQYVGTATVQTEQGNTTVTVHQTFTETYTRIGATTVARPNWIDQARSGKSTTTTATAAEVATIFSLNTF